MSRVPEIGSAAAPAAVILGLALALSGCNGGSGGDSGGSEVSDTDAETQAPQTPDREGPRIAFVDLINDLGTFAEIETRTTRFPFTNDGSERLTIKKVTTDCGCTIATPGKWWYAPGETGYIEVEFNPTGPGTKTKYVTVVSDGRGANIQRLTIKGVVTGFLEIEPRVAQFDVRPLGVEHRERLRVKCNDPDFILEEVEATSEHIEVRILPEEEAREAYGVDARFTRWVDVIVRDDAPWGPDFGQLHITISARPTPDAEPISHTSRIRTAVQIFGRLRAEPHSFTFGGYPGEHFRRVVRLSRPDGRPFTAEVVSSRCVPILDAQVSIEQVGPGAYDVVLEASSQSLPNQYSGGVVLRTDVSGEEEITIPINGITRAAN
ncbi:MAG: DUF1573 domain-containing protein [Planctomycetes bacterium]|nr:DUF1573 domain-containing protein [Planctomycetota bacterium]